MTSTLHQLLSRKSLGIVWFILIVSCTQFEPVRVNKVETGAASDLAYSSCTVEGIVLEKGTAGIEDHGFCYSTQPNPTVGNADLLELGSRSTKGSFSGSIIGLDPGITYHYKAYLLNTEGVVYGDQASFITLVISVPEIETKIISSVTESSAKGGGNVISDGGSEVTARGVCWSTSPQPVVTDSHVSSGSGTGSFTSSISGLECNTTYYVRAYATNAKGTTYGSQENFTTSECPAGTPEVITTGISNPTENSAQGGGEVIDEGTSGVTARGVCYGISENPTLSGAHTEDGTGLGTFISQLTGLTSATEYYVRAYATNASGTSYGSQQNFTTLEDNEVTDIDGNVYPTIEIGTQIWMAENLRVTHYPDGVEIFLVEDTNTWDNFESDDKAYCWYNNNTANGEIYGALYTWAAAVNGLTGSSDVPSGIQGVCPDGWHLPSDEEWKQLEMYLGMSQADADNTGSRGDQGGELKETGTVHWDSPNFGATNSTGFTALATGLRKHDGTFLGQGLYGNFWTASNSGAESAWVHGMNYSYTGIYRALYSKVYGFPVRCVKD